MQAGFLEEQTPRWIELSRFPLGGENDKENRASLGRTVVPAMERSVSHDQIPRLERDFVYLTIFARISCVHFAIHHNGKIDAVSAMHSVTFFARDHSWGAHVD